MNKKISTLLAAFLAAGFSLTTEAGVVKVTSPKTGNSYVIAGQSWSVGSDKPILISNGAGVEGSANKDITSFTATPATDLWQYTGTPTGFKLSFT